MSQPATTILLVDPDARARALLSGHLQSLGCRILEAADGASALRIVTAEPVTLVVTELYLATSGAADLIGAIRAIKALRRTRTVAHTSRRQPADREWASQMGADAYLIKPTRAERMRYVVGRLTAERPARSDARKPGAAATSHSGTPPMGSSRA